MSQTFQTTMLGGEEKTQFSGRDGDEEDRNDAEDRDAGACNAQEDDTHVEDADSFHRLRDEGADFGDGNGHNGSEGSVRSADNRTGSGLGSQDNMPPPAPVVI